MTRLGSAALLGYFAPVRGFWTDRPVGELVGVASALELHEGRDQRWVEMAAALRLDLGQRLLARPRTLVRALRQERVVHVADRGDPSGERDGLAGQAAWVARPVPALVVGEGDLLGLLEERRGRAREDRRADRGVRLHDLPLLGIELA